jgi:DNA-binding transcriptional MerR regulator
MTISEFARRSGLSHKALRLYDLSGLLQPTSVDPSTGYRRYTADQFARARRISLLRQVDMPLAAIAEVLDGDDSQAVWLLQRWWAGQEASMRAKRETMEFLHKQLLRGGAEPPDRPYPVTLREVAEAKVVAIRHDVTQQDLVAAMNDADGRIREHLLASGAVCGPELWVTYHSLVGPDTEGTIEVALSYTGVVEPSGPIAIRIEPAHTEAYCTVTRNECSYPRIIPAYGAVDDWIREAGLEGGPPREVYFAAWDEIGGDDPFAHVTQPVKGNIHA